MVYILLPIIYRSSELSIDHLLYTPSFISSVPYFLIGHWYINMHANHCFKPCRCLLIVNLIPIPSIILMIEFTYYIVLTALDSFTYLFHRFISPFWDNWQFAQFAQMLTGFGLPIWDLSRIWSADVPRVQIRASPIIQIIWKHHVQGFDFSCYWSFTLTTSYRHCLTLNCPIIISFYFLLNTYIPTLPD